MSFEFSNCEIFIKNFQMLDIMLDKIGLIDDFNYLLSGEFIGLLIDKKDHHEFTKRVDKILEKTVFLGKLDLFVFFRIWFP